ncbi:hypothetical protein D3C81_1960000 [compost metagenome]
MNHFRPFRLKAGVPCNHDARSALERLPAERFPCFAAHKHPFTERLLLEISEIPRQMPWHIIILADNVIGAHRPNHADTHIYALLFKESSRPQKD